MTKRTYSALACIIARIPRCAHCMSVSQSRKHYAARHAPRDTHDQPELPFGASQYRLDGGSLGEEGWGEGQEADGTKR